MKEPSVKIQMVDESPMVGIVGADNIAGGVVISDCGTINNKLFNSSDEVLKEFTKSGKISRSTDTTLIHAAAIADIMPILLKRSFMDSGVRAGIAVFKNEGAATTTDYAFTFSGYPTPSGITAKSATGNKKMTVRISDDKKTLSIIPQFDFDHIEITISETIEDIYTELNGDVTYYKTSQYSSNKIEFSKMQSAGTAVVFELSTEIATFDTSITAGTSIKKKIEQILTKNGTLMNYVSTMTVGSGVTVKNFKIAIDSVIYYNELSEVPEKEGFTTQAISGISNQSTMLDVVASINKLLKTKYIDYDGTTWKLYSTAAITELASDAGYNDSYASSSTAIVSDYSILLIANNPSVDPLTARIMPNTEDEDLIDVSVQTASRTYEYTGSTDPEYINQYGFNQFIENINDYTNIPFMIKVNGTVEASSVLDTDLVEFGKMNIDLGKSTETRKAALEALCDQDDYKIAFLCPLGYVNNAYLSKLTSYNTKIWAFTPIGMYVEHDDPEEIIANRPNVNTEYAMIMAPHDKSTLLTDWVVDMTLEVAYLAKIQSNKSKRWEFAPMLGKENSQMTLTSPSVALSKKTREALLDVRIMSLISRNNKTVHYLNKNKCSAGDTVLSEDQNARLACKINRDLDTLLEPIIGKYNVDETRSRVIKTINQYFTDNIINQVFSIDSYTPICDETNNPPYIRANNQLVVDLSVVYLNAIYDVLVYHRALDVASNNE